MKTYFRLLSFASPIGRFALPFIPLTLLAVVFNTLNLALLAPMLEALFSTNKCLTENAIPTVVPPIWDIMGTFNYYVNYSIVHYSKFGTLKLVCGAIVVSVLLANIFKYLSQRIIENLRIHTLLNIRKTIFSNVMDLHIGFFNSERKGDIMAKIASDVQVVQFSVTNTLQIVFREPLQLIAYVVTLFLISAELTFYSLLVVPITALIIAKIVSNLKQQATASQESFSNMISILDEALSGIKIIKAFNATDLIKDKFDNENLKFSKLGRSMSARQQLASPISEFMGVAMVACVVLYGGYLILSGDTSSSLKPASFIMYIAMFSQVLRPAKAITDSFSGIHSGIAAGERVLALIDEKPGIVNKAGAREVNSFKEKIILDDVCFNYGNKEILKHINLVIPRGKTVALVGPSGGGKSTLMDLIPRFMEPNGGRILFDGIDIQDIKMESLRTQMGFVNQESILFNDTIFNNIAFGKPDAKREEVEAAARIANAHEFILKTSKGYDTFVGDRGIRLSGGQKQRISIARAVLANPPIMLLDEATSALDTESEKLVQDALNKLMENRTSLVIAHRLSTIQNADIIVVIDAGRIVEKGSHRELITNDGLYKRLIDMQAFGE
ncbi:MAG: ABC transporter ATP-binding protein [Sphingobacteriaceae bacterium]|nr:ABC transporter ATP-binding protein [Sphingobacteriaceae bacterium]